MLREIAGVSTGHHELYTALEFIPCGELFENLSAQSRSSTNRPGDGILHQKPLLAAEAYFAARRLRFPANLVLLGDITQIIA